MSAIGTSQETNAIVEDKFLKISIVIWMFVGLCFFFVTIRTTAGFFARSVFMDYMKYCLNHGQPISKPMLFMFNFLHFLLTGGLVYEVTCGMAGVDIILYFNDLHTALVIRGAIFLFLSLMCALKVLALSGKILSGNTLLQTALSWATSIGCILSTPLLIVPGIFAIIGTIIDQFAKKNRVKSNY